MVVRTWRSRANVRTRGASRGGGFTRHRDRLARPDTAPRRARLVPHFTKRRPRATPASDVPFSDNLSARRGQTPPRSLTLSVIGTSLEGRAGPPRSTRHGASARAAQCALHDTSTRARRRVHHEAPTPRALTLRAAGLAREEHRVGALTHRPPPLRLPSGVDRRLQRSVRAPALHHRARLLGPMLNRPPPLQFPSTTQRASQTARTPCTQASIAGRSAASALQRFTTAHASSGQR